MKNFKLLLATAVIFAVGSSFASVKSAVAGEYVLNGDTWQLKGNGTCQQIGGICDYTKTGDAVTEEYPNELQNPANFTANNNGTYVP
jgi:hypothetical protein